MPPSEPPAPLAAPFAAVEPVVPDVDVVVRAELEEPDVAGADADAGAGAGAGTGAGAVSSISMRLRTRIDRLTSPGCAARAWPCLRMPSWTRSRPGLPPSF